MSVEIVGRDAELAAVEGFLDSTRDGPAALVLEGDAGIGKTTLWQAAVVRAGERGFRVLAARPGPAEAQLSHASLADLLGGVEQAVLDCLPGPQRRAVDAVLLRGDSLDVATDRRATGAALLSVVERLADDSPVLLAIDDLQWVDTSSAQAVDFTARRLAGRVGVLTAARTGECARPEVTDPSRVERLPVGPLSLGALHGMLHSRLGRSFPRPTMVRIHQVSGGNPFYAIELARGTDGATLPRSLTGLLDARIDGVDVAVRAALSTVAALAEPTVNVVRHAVGADADRLLADAERADLIRLDGHRIRFTHPLLAAACYAAASASDRRATHRRLAAVVDGPEERARHLALAAVHADEETVCALDAAARLARSRGATAAAAELLDLAIGLGADTPERRVRRARHHFDAGDPIRARALAEELVTELPAGRARAEALRLLATIRLHDDSYQESALCLEQALTEADGDLALRVSVLIDLLFVLVNLGRIPEALARTGAAVAAAERLGDPDLLAKALAGSVMVGFLSGRGFDEPTMRRALDLEDPELPGPVVVRPSLIHSLLLWWTDRLDEAHDLLMALRGRCLQRGEESDLMFTAFHTVWLDCARGDFAGARLIAEDTTQRAQQLGTDFPRAIALAVQAQVDAHAGMLAEASDAAGTALEIFQRGGSMSVTVWPLTTLGLVALSVPDHEQAATILGPMAAAAVAHNPGEPAVTPFAADAAEALIGVGRLDEAAELIDQLERDGVRLRRAGVLGLAARCRSVLLATRGELDAAADSAERAVSALGEVGMPFEQARARLALGQIHRRRKQKKAAADALGAAAQAFDQLGTPLWAARARADLERVSVSPAGATALTPSEHRVAELAASGMTNREVSAALFISPKTVEANLARVYRKLGIHSRAQLGQRRAELGG